MAWSYSGDPTTSDRDRLRFELGDTDQADPLLQDEEIDYCLARESTFVGALARAAEAVAQRFAREASTRVGQLSLDLAARARQWSERAKEYRRLAAAAHAPSAGGVSLADKAAALSDPDRPKPYFRLGMHDYASGDEG